jgi:serine/threonine protein kinase
MLEPTRDERMVPPKLPLEATASSAVEHTAGLGAPAPAEDELSFLETPQAQDELGRLAHYRVLKELGRGGMGCVLLAEDTKLQRHVALKVMLPRFARDARAKERFLREARAAARIKHDHVITIFQVDEANGVPFIALEFLEGAPLDKYLKNKGALPLALALRIAREMAEGLAAAHQQGLIHRDIKPGNVWLEAPKGRVKILDFGLARAAADDTHLTQSGAIVGTPAFMAPEQARGEKVDGRCDLFSLGVVL